MFSAKLFLASFGGTHRSILFGGRSAPEYFHFNFEVVQTLAEADFAVIPNAVRKVSPEFMEHVRRTVAYAKTLDKKTIVFISGDLGYRIHMDGALAFKVSEYAHGKRRDEIISPPFVEDFWEGARFEPRRKSARPSVSFCGYAGFPSSVTRAKYILRNTAFDTAALFAPHWGAHKRGIYFRRKAIELLKEDSHIDARFMIRNAFFLNAAPTPQDRDAARKEFLENLRNSDFALAPKGDGNYSIRFFEALSMGRIPILIDTDMVLPLEKEIDYSKFIVRVPHTQMHTLPGRIAELYNSLSDEQFAEMQRAAREAFVTHLRQDSFYNIAFPLLRDRGPEAL